MRSSSCQRNARRQSVQIIGAQSNAYYSEKAWNDQEDNYLWCITQLYYCKKHENAHLFCWRIFDQSKKKTDNRRLFSSSFLPLPVHFLLPSPLRSFSINSEEKGIISKQKRFLLRKQWFQAQESAQNQSQLRSWGSESGFPRHFFDGCDLQGLPFLLRLFLTCSFLMFPTKSILAFRSNFMAFGVP